QPADLDTVLAKRGYRRVAPVCVQVAPAATVIERLGTPSAFVVSIAPAFDEAWFAAYCEAEQVSALTADARRDILRRIAPATAFAGLHLDSQLIAIGLGVLDEKWLGIFNMVTVPAFR